MIDTTLDRAYLLEQERREVEPERLLIAQVLNRGLLDACDQRKQRPRRRQVCQSSPNPERKLNAYDWVMSEDAAPMSCRWICDVLGLDHDAVREKVRANPEKIHHFLYQKHSPGRG